MTTVEKLPYSSLLDVQIGKLRPRKKEVILSRNLWLATGYAEFKDIISDSQASSALTGRCQARQCEHRGTATGCRGGTVRRSSSLPLTPRIIPGVGGACRWGEGVPLEQNVLSEGREQEPEVVRREDGWGAVSHGYTETGKIRLRDVWYQVWEWASVGTVLV